MTDRSRAPFVLAAVVLAAVVLAAGACGTGPGDRDLGGAPRSEPRVTLPTAPMTPGQTLEVLPPPPPVAWADGGRRLAVTTWGSSSCPTGPTGVEVAGPQEVHVEVAFLDPGQEVCTADMAPRTTEVELPDGVSADARLTVVLEHDGDEERIELPPADA